MRYILLLFLLTGCSHKGNAPAYSVLPHQTHRKPIVTILPMEDCTQASISMKTAKALTHSIMNRLEKKNQLNIVSTKAPGKQFHVSMKLIQHQESLLNPSELAFSIHLKIIDIRSDKPQIVLQEVINHNTILERPVSKNDLICLENDSFHVSPIGLAHAKLTREIATRIEDYIKLSTKG